MRLALALACALPASAVAAQDKPVTAVDVATTPLSDLNLRKEGIPAILLAAQERPYDRTGLGKCAAIAQAIIALDQVLGPDLDLPPPDAGKLSPGSVAKAAVASFIPFRGLIREISGANAQDRKAQDAIEAGLARRAYLKGYGEARGCKYPARAATPAVITAQEAGDKTRYVSQPVVQGADKPR